MTALAAIRRAAGLALGIAVAVAVPLAAEAGNSSPAASGTRVAQPNVAVPRVPVPAPFPGGGLAGCWSANRLIYGPYVFSFCTNGAHGTYQVRGGGLYCDGRVSVAPSWGGGVTVRLSRSGCNGRTDWSADYLVCRPAHGGGWGGYAGGYKSGASDARVAVPQVPAPRVPAPHVPVGGQRLDCTYYPVVAGYHPIGLAFSRR